MTAICLVLIAALSTSGPAAFAQHKTDYCKNSKSSTLFLVDRTTPYDEVDRKVIIDSIGAAVDGLDIGDRIVVATIGSHYSKSERLVNACKPGCPKSNNPLDSMLGGCSTMRAMADEREFLGRLRSTLRPLTQGSVEAENSDITGTIAQWTQRPPGGMSFGHVYLFSDMLENSQALPWHEFKAMKPEAAIEVARKYGLLPSTPKAEVRIVGFGRLHDPGRPPLPADLDARLRAFWISYFGAGSAANVSFEGAIQR
jgi:hypothetical protein